MIEMGVKWPEYITAKQKTIHQSYQTKQTDMLVNIFTWCYINALANIKITISAPGFQVRLSLHSCVIYLTNRVVLKNLSNIKFKSKSKHKI